MAKRGRKPQDPEMRVIKRGDRARDVGAILLSGFPERPARLDAVARAEWDRIAALLDEAGVLSRFDGPLLAVYCGAYGRLHRAEETIAKEGIVVDTAMGAAKVHPAVTVANTASRTMTKILEELGRRLAGGVAEEKDELGEFLSQRKGG